MKRTELLLTIIAIPLDFLMISLAGITAYFLRFQTFYRELSPITIDIPLNEFLPILFISAFVLLLFLAMMGLYSFSVSKRLLYDVFKIFNACSLGLVLIVFMFFFNRDLFASRFIVLVAWGLSIIFIFFSHFSLKLIRFLIYKKGIGVKRIIIIGQNKLALVLENFFNNHPAYGYKVISKIPVIDNQMISFLREQVEKNSIDEIIQLDANISKELSERLIDISYEKHIVYKYAPDFYGTKITNVEVMPIGGIPIVTLKQTPLEKWGYIYKRLFDIIISLLLIIVFSPILIVIAILIKIDSKGPILYKNERIGKRGSRFYTYKFRTMFLKYCTGVQYDKEGQALATEQELIIQKNERKGPLYKVLDDPRRTKFGKFLEKTSLDELPSFFNVFIGTMSLVGPRPHQSREVSKYEACYKRILEIKPGVTGLAQISGRSDLDFEDEATLDIFYIENWSFWLDIIILFKTPFAVLKAHK